MENLSLKTVSWFNRILLILSSLLYVREEKQPRQIEQQSLLFLVYPDRFNFITQFFPPSAALLYITSIICRFRSQVTFLAKFETHGVIISTRRFWEHV